MKNWTVLEIASLVLAVALLLCLCPMPYGFYTIVRLATAVVGVCWAIKFYNEQLVSKAVVSGAIAILFQPLVKITLDRITWNVVDVITAILLIALILNIKKGGK